jgi:pentatricopeptide repeat protein
VKDAAKCAETMQEMRRAGVVPNVTSYNTLMNAYKNAFQGERCLELFQQMRLDGVCCDSFTLSTLFCGLLNGFHGNRSTGAVKVVELSRDRSVLPLDRLNHFVASTVLRAHAEVGSLSDVDSFWRQCADCFGHTREGWPGSSRKILHDLSQKCAGKGQWNRVAQLLQEAPFIAGSAGISRGDRSRPLAAGGTEASKPCHAFRNGSCKFGSSCRFQH